MIKPDYASLLSKAIIIATKAHGGAIDKGGNPYILHPIAVAHRVENLEEKIVALLHDTIEDTDVTEEYLRELGFPELIISGVISVTRMKDETYMEFCIRSSLHPIGKKVKIADLLENMDKRRLKNPTKEDIEHFESRCVRYQKALDMLLAS